jgi:hypothetical protein
MLIANYPRAARQAAWIAAPLALATLLGLAAFEPHRGFGVLYVLGAPVIALLEFGRIPDWPTWLLWAIGGALTFAWLWLWAFAACALLRSKERKA